MDEFAAPQFEAFRRQLADWLDVDPQRVDPQAYFITDLAVDSVKLIELLVRLEKAGYQLTPEVVWSMQTVGDAYRYFNGGPGAPT